MRSLSNFLRRGDAVKTGDAPVSALSRPARPEEVHPALRMILGSGGRLADNQQLLDFLHFTRQRNIDLSQLWITESAGQIVWGILPIHSPGRTTLLFTPADPSPASAAVAIGMLLDGVCARCAGQNVQLAQALLDPADSAGRRILETQGFTRMAELIYLHAAIKRPLQPPPLAPEWVVLEYTPETHALFASAIIASYQNSLDCPGLNGVRDIEDIIAGHKASGEFDPKHWLVVCERDEHHTEAMPRGVLLLTRLPRGDAAELVYLGIAPEARGRGLGEWLMRCAFTIAARMPVGRLSLAVDSANSPALKLYYRFGMAKLGSKVAMMRKLV